MKNADDQIKAWNKEQELIERQKCDEAEACQDTMNDDPPKRVVQRYLRDERRIFEERQRVKMKVRR